MIKMNIPSEIIRLSTMTPEGFKKIYWKIIQTEHVEVGEAYEKTEQVHQEFFGNRKYASFESFRISTRKI